MTSCRGSISFAACAAVLALSVEPVFPEGIRTVVASVVQVSADRSEGETILLGHADAIAIVLPAASPFIQGIEIDLRIPKPLQSAQGAFAWSLYKTVSPLPAVDRVAYDGERVLLQALPPRTGIVLQIPVSPRHSLRTGPYATVLPVLLGAADFPVLFKLSALTKGLTLEQEQSRYQVKVRPLFTDEGALRLTLSQPDDAEAAFAPTVYVDERRVDSWQDLVFLKKGMHSVQVTGEGMRDETRSFAVEPGKVFSLEIRLQGTKPILVFEAPANAVILLDDQPIEHAAGARLFVEPGERTVVCRIGDYILTRKFTAVRGKTYHIVFTVDVQIQEKP